MAQITETPLFIMESEITTFSQCHPEYNYYTRVYYKDNTFVGYLAYKNKPQN
uniref:Uncharacterized protein n=1 Tax=Geladintestivirus 6 TaxID=3233138 RepID=A0AAU8MHG9_9CAUD